jgi:hypothetical protein
MPPATLALAISHPAAWLTLRHFIVVLSIVAAAVNIAGIIPQLRTMLRARSASGQSPLGWTLAATCSGSLLYVNVVGYHAFVLAAGNFLSLSGCMAAALLARYFRTRGGIAAEALQAVHDAPEDLVSELPAPDLQALAGTVLEEHHRRTGGPIPEETVTEMATGEFQALADVVFEEHRRRTRKPELSLAPA